MSEQKALEYQISINKQINCSPLSFRLQHLMIDAYLKMNDQEVFVHVVVHCNFLQVNEVLMD